ncbi:MAG: hypothetical protein K0Q79_25 [Flavipsychrobacter sp.]|nr:hypothetical protein [Flavipsychrobacter sp.]
MCELGTEGYKTILQKNTKMCHQPVMSPHPLQKLLTKI